MNGKLQVATIVAFYAVLVPGGSILAATLSGRVYEGSVGDESKALGGVTVTLYGSNNSGQQGTYITSTTTNSDGWYGLEAEGAFDYFNIVQTNLSGYTSEGATTVGGSVQSDDWIQYDYLGLSGTTTGNKFWDKKEGGAPPENNPPVAVDDTASTSENTAVDIDVLNNDSDPDGDPLHINSATSPPHGSTVNHGSHVTYTPDPGFTGTDTFDYTAGDGKGGTDTATVTVTVGASQEPWTRCEGYKWNDMNGNGTHDAGEPNLPGWTIYLDTNLNRQLDAGEPQDTTDAQGRFLIEVLWPEPRGAVTIGVEEVMQGGWEQTSPGGGPILVSFDSSQMQTIYVSFGNRRLETPPPADEEACCLPDGLCADLTPEQCRQRGGTPQGPGTSCRGDSDGDGIDDVCGGEPPAGVFDFGDAPRPYPTLQADQGAYHDVNPALCLGVSIDADLDGQPDASAAGDDSHGADDEDGVTFTSTLQPGAQATVQVSVSAPQNTYVNVTGWIDFNGDSQWQDPQERIFSDNTWAPVTLTKPFAVPANAPAGTATFARFRLCRADPQADFLPSPTGYGGEGEVEDYQVLIGREGSPTTGRDYVFDLCFNVEITLPDGSVHKLSLSGPATERISTGPNGQASDTNGNGRDDAPAELVDLQLTGIDPVLGNVKLALNPVIPSTGQTEEQINNVSGVLDIPPFTASGSADSFFDVWLQIDVPSYGVTVLSNKAKRLGGVINHLPPATNAYSETAPTTTDFVDQNGQLTGVRLGPITSCGSTPPPVEGEYDFGDAPAPYPDASHAPGTVWLGFAAPDTEAATQANPPGAGDDTYGIDDEDGAALMSDLVPGQFAWLGLALSGSNQDLTYAVWIDYNHNGNWEHPAELFASASAANLPASPLGVVIANGIPAGAQIGTTYMRCRVYPGRNAAVSPTGNAQGGEVEDYQVQIKQTGQIQPAGHVITGIKFNDLDGDGIWDPVDGEARLPNWTIWLDTNGDGRPDQTTTTDGNGGFEFPPVAPGTYTIGEQQQPGWTQTAPPAPGTLTITVPGGPLPTISFSMFGNRRTGGSGSVTVVKRAVPADDTPFDFAAHTPGGFFDVLVSKLSDPSANTWSIADLDRLQKVVETVPAGWTLKDITVTGDADHGSSVDLASATVHVDYDEGENIVIVFENVKDGLDGLDYGDAPLPYPAASHQLGGPYLGLFGDAPDPESDMQRDTQAAGDDNDAGGDDENGLLFINLVKTAGAWSTWELKGYFGLSSDAKFGLWIDLNGDGDWDDLNELRATFGFCGFGAGPQDWFHALGAFQLPADAKVGETYARLRVYGDCNATVSPSGAGGPGEVEDHLVEIKADGPGLPPGGIVHGYKWNDLNGNGQWNPNEPPLAGWTIWLDTNNSGKQDAGDMTTQTDAQGRFRFTGVPAGTYTLGEQLQAGWTQTTPGGAGTYVVTVQPGQASLPQMFGNRQSGGATTDGRICGSKWNDLNGDGVPDAPEPSLANWRIYLDLNQNGLWDAGEPFQFTDATGSFEFAGLAVGSYTVAEEVQAGWQQTWPGGAGTHTISIQPGTAQPACVMFGNTTRPVPPPPDKLKQLDWGDAPDPTYPTLRAGNGAYHTIATGFHLGQGVDDEPDGQPAPDALGDDHFGADDEDGVIFLTPILPGGMAGLEIAASAAGFVDAWIDFDSDGSWSQGGDRILTAEPVAAGFNVLSVAIPASAALNTATFARFRLSRTGGLPPEGPGQDGEVEDYHVLIGPEGPGVPGEGQRPHVKWSQPPMEIDPNLGAPPVFCGWGEVSTSTQDLGGRRSWSMKLDDFHCLGPIPITRIRWWGSYKAWEPPELPEVLPDHWRICFWANEPDDLKEDPFLPERVVHTLDVAPERVSVKTVGLSEFPDARSEMCFAYEVTLEPHEFFHQAEFPADERVFWVSITAVYPEGASRQNGWRWMTRPWVWGHGAEGFVLYDEGPDAELSLFPGLFSPVFRASPCDRDEGYDLCFELLTDQPWVKWDQPFTGVRDWPDYTDLESQGVSIRGEENIGRIVADDWFCERDTPVIAAAWWGSYIGYGYEACQCEPQLNLPRPDYFLLTLLTNVGPDRETDYTRPGDVVWQFRAYEYDEVLVGYDKNPEGEPNEPVFRYSVRLPEDNWFRQEAPGTLYWFSVMAVYTDPLPMIVHPWGWTNHRPMFESAAVFIDYRAHPRPEWRPLRDSLDRPVDMSFTLFTRPE